MTGIPVYTQSPITAAKVDGTTPKTASPPSGNVTSGPADNPATTTATASTTSSYPAVKPGAYPVPAPTNSSGQPTGPAHNYIPSPPTPTKTTRDDGPPAPQPGAVPVPPSGITSNLPPPPKAGGKYVPPAPRAMTPQPYPPQIGYSSPSSTYQPPTSSTMTASAPSRSYPAAVPTQQLGVADNVAPRASFEHPPGYQQNPYASNQTAEQRAVSQQQAEQSNQWHHAGALNDGTDEGGIWDTAKKWAYSAGEKMAETEAQVWKRINGEK